MNGLLDFWQFYFAPIGQPWWHGAVYGNIVAVPLCAALAYVALFRKLVECNEKNCHRFAFHHVENTHFKTCPKHTTKEIHDKLLKLHKAKYPEQHAFLSKR